MYQQFCLIVMLSALLGLSKCTMYCITSASLDNIDDQNSPCVTLSQFANSAHEKDSSVILMLQPGNHTLNTTLSVINVSEFRMVSSGSANTNVLCENRGQFVINRVDIIVIDGLTFIGCKETEATSRKLTSNETLLDAENCTSVLVLREVTSAKVCNSAFLRHRIGSSQFNCGSAVISNIASNLSILNSTFEHNSARAIYSDLGSKVTLNTCQFLRNSANYGGVIYANNSHVQIDNCQFSYNKGEAGLRVIFLFKSLTTITGTNFTRNSEVILAAFTNITMVNCYFDDNDVPSNAGPTRSMYDTYDAIVVATSSVTVMIKCSFYANNANENGGILVFSNTTIITDNEVEFVNNKAFEGTVVMLSSRAIFKGKVKFNSNIGSLSALQSEIKFVGHVSFLNCTSSTREDDIIRGGAVTLYFSVLNVTGPFAEAEFIDNHAINGGGLYAAESTVTIDAEMTITNNTAQAVGGAIFIYRTSLIIRARVIVSFNQAERGGGVYAESAAITLTSSKTSTFHSLVIINNEANDGGGLYFSSNARLYVYQLDPRPHNITVRLASNRAQNGGAIYVNDATNTGTCNGLLSGLTVTLECFFQIVDLYKQKGILELTFESNDASKGSVIYGGLLDRCRITVLTNSSFFDTSLGSSFAPSDGLSYFSSISNLDDDLDSISSDPVKVCFCFEDKPNCNIKVYTVRDIEKGETFTIPVAAVDQAEHVLNANIIAEVQSGGLGNDQQSQMVYSECTNLTYSVTSSNDNETVSIYADGPCRNAEPSTRMINITFSDCSCPIGFEVNSPNASTCECVCSTQLDSYIQNCMTETMTFEKLTNFWIDYSNDSGFLISHSCPFDYCNPSLLVSLTNGSDVQCENNRAGVLCGGCKETYSLSLDETSCVMCDSKWPLYTILVILTSLILGIFIVMMTLFLNLTVTVGTINGFYFSANIIRAMIPFPSQNYPTYFLFVLNFEIGLNICFYNGFDTYVKTWFQLGYPVYLIFIVVMVIFMSQYSTTFARCIGKRNPVETLATLIFLSYSKLLQFPINALSYGELVHPNGTQYKQVWLPDAKIGYFDGKHTVMFIAAIIVMVLVSIYTLLLFFWQWIVKLPNWKILSIVRNTKVQLFIEMYHIPYNSGYRYWTGLLLLIRIIVYLVAVVFDLFATYLAVILMLSFLFVIKSLSTRVYKKWPVDVLESVLIVNTIALAAVASYTSITNDKSLPRVATYLFTFVMGISLIVVILYHLYEYVLKGKLTIKKWPFTRGSKPSVTSVETDNLQQDAQSNVPRPLNVDRFNSVLVVMGDVTDNDYRQLRIQQELELHAETIEQDQDPVPVPEPTFSVLEGPLVGQHYVPYNNNQ